MAIRPSVASVSGIDSCRHSEKQRQLRGVIREKFLALSKGVPPLSFSGH